MSEEGPGGEWVELKPLSWRQELAAVWMFVKRDFLLQTHFKFSYFINLLETVDSQTGDDLLIPVGVFFF